MSVQAIIMAAAGRTPTLHQTTYTASGTATWPLGATLDLDGIGGPRTSTPTGYSSSQYPTLSTTLGGNNADIETYSLSVTSTGYPSSVDTVGTGLSGSSVSFAFPGGWITSSPNPGHSPTVLYFNAFTSYTLPINRVATGGGVVGYCDSSNLPFDTTSGTLYLSDYAPGSPAGGVGAYYDSANLSYSAGPSATLVVNAVTKTFAGQTAGGVDTHTTFTSVGTGATTSGTLTIPTGGSITVSYYT